MEKPEPNPIAIFGAGWVARHCYGVALRHANLQLSAVYDPDIKAAEDFCNDLQSGTVCHSVDQLLETQPDLVIVATPNYLHTHLSELALRAGCTVLCEKPLATTRATTRQLLDCGNSRLFVSSPNRYRPDFKALLHLIRQGALGSVYRVRLSWERVAGFPRPGSWYTTRQYSQGGVLVDLGSHLLDIGLLILQPSSPVSVSSWLSSPFSSDPECHRSTWMLSRNQDSKGNLNVETEASLIVSFTNDAILEVHTAWAGYGDEDRTVIEVEGEDGKATLSTLFGYSSQHLTPPTLTLWSKNGRQVSQFNFTRRAEEDFGEMMNSIMEPHAGIRPCTGHEWLPIVEILEGSYATRDLVQSSLAG